MDPDYYRMDEEHRRELMQFLHKIDYEEAWKKQEEAREEYYEKWWDNCAWKQVGYGEEVYRVQVILHDGRQFYMESRGTQRSVWKGLGGAMTTLNYFLANTNSVVLEKIRTIIVTKGHMDDWGYQIKEIDPLTGKEI